MSSSTPSEATKEVAFDSGLDPLIIAENNRLAFNNRIFISILLGVGAGVLGLENLWGVLFYIVGSALGLFVFLFLKTGLKSANLYFQNATQIISASLSTNLFTFVMVWTLFYDIVHVYV
jgi:hypothetical protein